MGFGVVLTTLPCKNKIVEKFPRNSAGFCGGGQGLSWTVEPRKEEEYIPKKCDVTESYSTTGVPEMFPTVAGSIFGLST
jgi:hypothetical protein